MSHAQAVYNFTDPMRLNQDLDQDLDPYLDQDLDQDQELEQDLRHAPRAILSQHPLYKTSELLTKNKTKVY